MELRQLKYFIAIVDSGSMMKASAQLHIAQPSLSVQMAKLEQEFGVALLARKARGVTPTDAGAAFYRHAETIIKMLADSHEVVRRTKQTTAGRVRLGMPAYMAATLAAPLIAMIRSRSSTVAIEISEHMGYDQLFQISNDQVDITVLLDERESHPGIRVEPLLREPIAFLRARGSGDPLPASISLAQAAGHPFVLTPIVGYRALLDQAFEAAGAKLNVVAEARGTQIIVNLVADGIGASLLPRSTFLNHRRMHELEHCDLDPPIWRTTSLGYSTLYPLSRASGLVRDAIIDVLAAQVRTGLWSRGEMLHERADVARREDPPHG